MENKGKKLADLATPRDEINTADRKQAIEDYRNMKIEDPDGGIDLKFVDETSAKQAQQDPAPQERMDPEIGILSGIERNLFFDVGLQSIGHVIIGSAFQQNPDLGDDDYLTQINRSFSGEEHNGKGADYEIIRKHAWKTELNLMYSGRLQNVIDRTGKAMRELMQEYKGRIVAGTMRMYVEFLSEPGELQGTLICIVTTEPNGGKDSHE